MGPHLGRPSGVAASAMLGLKEATDLERQIATVFPANAGVKVDSTDATLSRDVPRERLWGLKGKQFVLAN